MIFTISEQTQELIRGIKEPLTMTNYVNVVHYTAPYGAPKNRIADKRQFESYQRFLPDMKMNYVVYYDTINYDYDTTLTLQEKAIKACKAYGFNFKNVLTPSQIHNKIDLLPEENRFVRMVNVNGKTTPLRMYDDIFAYPGEPEINAAIKRLLSAPAIVGFLAANEERSVRKVGDKDYKAITTNLPTRNALINQGFEVREISLDTLEALPLDMTALVIADPKIAYSEEQSKKILAYIENGGNAIIACEPGRQQLLNPVLAPLGIKVSEGTLLQESDNYGLDLLQAKTADGSEKYGFGFFADAIVTLPTAAALEYTDTGKYVVQPLLITNKKEVWNKTGKFDLNTEKITFDSTIDHRVSAPVTMALTRKTNGREQKIVISGDADFLSNVEVSRFSPNNVNASFVIRMFRWLSNGEYPVASSRPKSIDTKITVTRKQINFQKLLYLGILPLIITLGGAATLIMRKRK